MSLKVFKAGLFSVEAVDVYFHVTHLTHDISHVFHATSGIG